jgi:hypothetical protein
MEFSIAELFLFGWCLVVTMLWQQTKHELRVHRAMTGEVMMRIAQGRIKVNMTEDSFELEDVRK